LLPETEISFSLPTGLILGLIGKFAIEESVQSITRTLGMVEDVVWVVDSFRLRVADEGSAAAGARRVVKGVPAGRERRVRRGSFV
jgi:hypothetical protein